MGLGNPGGGRKGYEYEEAQLKKMKETLDWAFELAEKMRKGKATIKEEMAYGNLEKMVLKIMDKLHANKEAKREFDFPLGLKPMGIIFLPQRKHDEPRLEAPTQTGDSPD